MPPRAGRSHSLARGFTLVELLVALVAMALMALMSWRGLDSMLRSQQYTQAHTDAHAVLQTALAQWNADLDGLMALDNTQAIVWDGQTLRMTRRFTAAPAEGALVVAWARRASQGREQWLRWQSLPVRTRSEWAEAWNQAAQWARNPSDEQRHYETTLFPLLGWRIYFYRGEAWSNPLSSDNTSTPAISPRTTTKVPEIPDGVRLELELPPGPGLTGRLTLDWVNPLRKNNRV